MCAIMEEIREEGLKEGLKEGLEQGLKEGLEQGLEQGLEKGTYRTLGQLYQSGKLPMNEVCLYLNCTPEEFHEKMKFFGES